MIKLKCIYQNKYQNKEAMKITIREQKTIYYNTDYLLLFRKGRLESSRTLYD